MRNSFNFFLLHALKQQSAGKTQSTHKKINQCEKRERMRRREIVYKKEQQQQVV
jgi:hypothetical protein